MRWRGVGAWTGRRAVLGLLWAMVAGLVGTAWPGGWPATPTAEAQQPVTAWRLTRIIHSDTDGRGVKAGSLAVLEADANDRGGFVRFESRPDGCRAGGAATWTFRWNFVRDITRLVKGDTLAVNLAVQSGVTINCGLDPNSDPAMVVQADGDAWPSENLRQANLPTGPNHVLFTRTGGIFYGDPAHNGHVAAPRLVEVDRRFDTYRGFFAVVTRQRWGFAYEATYVYEAESANAPPPPPPGGGSAPALALGSPDLIAYCQDVGYDDALLDDGEYYCRLGDIGLSVDMDSACQYTFDREDAYARQTDPADPRSWVCYVPAR